MKVRVLSEIYDLPQAGLIDFQDPIDKLSSEFTSHSLTDATW